MSATAFTSAEVKLRTLAQQDAVLQANLGTDPMRWYNRRLQQNVVAEVTPGACVRVTRISTERQMNQGGIMDLTAIRLQVDVLDLDSETARAVANNVILFMGTINLCTNQQFESPITAISSNPTRLLNQRAGMIPNPANPNGPVYVESLDFRVWNLESLAIN